MARVKRGVTVRARHNKVLKLAKGYRGRNSTNVRQARERVEHGLQYAYRDRRKKKSAFRSLWILRDLFGAVFFVSVGMMVNPAMFVEYIWPILFITGGAGYLCKNRLLLLRVFAFGATT